jgi:hypothetical protein
MPFIATLSEKAGVGVPDELILARFTSERFFAGLFGSLQIVLQALRSSSQFIMSLIYGFPFDFHVLDSLCKVFVRVLLALDVVERSF